MTTRVLFVCSGNICRSPLGEAIFRHLVEEAALGARFEVDSAGTHGWHEGEPADPRARRVGRQRGVNVTSIARAVDPADFERFDVILAMDRGHLRELRARCPASLRDRIRLMREYEEPRGREQDVPDPYYSGEEAFEEVFELLDNCCRGLLEELRGVSVDFLQGELRRVLGDPGLRVTSVQNTGGGCIHHAARVSTTRGDVFAKWNEDCPADVFLREADGLRELGLAESGLVVPKVLAAEMPAEDRPAFIFMEYLPRALGRGGDDVALGHGLATLHRRSAPEFGFPVASYCGPTLQDNAREDTWAAFYAQRRLDPLTRRLHEEGHLGAAECRLLERLIGRIPSLVSPGPPPSLIHGDLWSGNVLSTERGPAVVDPACTYADREMEFGITTLFGGFSDRFFAAYEEAWPLPAGWRERNPIYQLYHLLNHHLIFGGHYGAQAVAIARRLV